MAILHRAVMDERSVRPARSDNADLAIEIDELLEHGTMLACWAERIPSSHNIGLRTDVDLPLTVITKIGCL